MKKLLLIILLGTSLSLQAQAHTFKWYYLVTTSIGCPDEASMLNLANMITRGISPLPRDIYAAQQSCGWISAGMYGIKAGPGDKLFLPIMLGQEGNATGMIVWLPRGLLRQIPPRVAEELAK